MRTSFTLKGLGLAVLGIAALLAGFISFQYAATKGSLSSFLGLSSSEGALASASSCNLSSVSLQDEVYFVSCGGFF